MPHYLPPTPWYAACQTEDAVIGIPGVAQGGWAELWPFCCALLNHCSSFPWYQMPVYLLWMLNKTGGLIFDKEFAPGVPNLSTNTTLKLASIFHAQHAIAQQLSPISGGGGIECIEADQFKLFSYETPTAIKFMLITDGQTSNADGTCSIPFTETR